MPVDPFQYSTPQANLLVKRLVVTDYASLPGGSASGVAFGFVYICTGGENPAGFAVPIPQTPPASFVALAGALVRAVGGGLALSAVIGQSSTYLTVACAAQPAVNDVIAFVIAP